MHSHVFVAWLWLAFQAAITTVSASDGAQSTEAQARAWEASLAMAVQRYKSIATSSQAKHELLNVAGTLECILRDATPEMTHNQGTYVLRTMLSTRTHTFSCLFFPSTTPLFRPRKINLARALLLSDVCVRARILSLIFMATAPSFRAQLCQ